MATDENNGRIPTKKRGRPRKEKTRASRAKEFGLSRDDFLTLGIAAVTMDEDLYRECLEKTGSRQMSKTVMGYVARMPREQQREALNKFSRMGARKTKRYFECSMHPPTGEKIVNSLGSFLWREFPTVGYAALADACLETARILRLLESDQQTNGL